MIAVTMVDNINALKYITKEWTSTVTSHTNSIPKNHQNSPVRNNTTARAHSHNHNLDQSPNYSPVSRLCWTSICIVLAICGSTLMHQAKTKIKYNRVRCIRSINTHLLNWQSYRLSTRIVIRVWGIWLMAWYYFRFIFSILIGLWSKVRFRLRFRSGMGSISLEIDRKCKSMWRGLKKLWAFVEGSAIGTSIFKLRVAKIQHKTIER